MARMSRRLLDRFDPDGQWRALQDAQAAIDANAVEEEAAGVTEETAEYLRLHDEFYAIRARLPWWKQWTLLLLDDERMNRADAEYWYSARTLSDLGELTAQWLEGTIGSQPGYQSNCGPDEETAALVPTLAAVNRAGFVTHGSQPGEGPVTGCDGWAWWQRAAVDGFADDVMVERLSTATAGTDLCLFVGSARRWRYDYSDAQPVTMRVDPASDVELVHTQFGVLIPRRGISFQYDACHRDTIRVLQQSWQVTIIDPQWGRNSVLWPVLDTVTAQVRN